MSRNFRTTTCDYCNKSSGEVFAYRKQPEFKVNEDPIYSKPFCICRECFDKNDGELEELG